MHQRNNKGSLIQKVDTEADKIALRLAKHLRDFSGLPSRNGLRSLLWKLKNTPTTWGISGRGSHDGRG